MAKKRGDEQKQDSSPEAPTFSDKEKELIKILLDYGQRNPDRWVDCKRIGEKLYAGEKISSEPRSNGWNILSRLAPKLKTLGVEVRQTKSTVYGTTVYSINPEQETTLEKICPDLFPQKHEKITALYLGELGFGTRAYDPRAGKGLGYLLKLNRRGDTTLRDSLDTVILSGGLIPFVPEFYTSALGANSMHLLDKKVSDVAELNDADAEKRIKQVLQDADIDNELKEFFMKHVAGKILTKTDAITTSRKRLEEILSKDFKGQVHYMYGEEDDANLQQLKEMEIVKQIEKTTEIKKQQKELEKDLATLRKEHKEYRHQKDMFDNMSTWLVRATNYKGKKFEENVSQFIEKYEDEITQLNKVSKNLGDNVLEILQTAKSKIDIERKIREAKEKLSKVEQEIKDSALKEDDLATRLNAIKRVREAPGFFRITKRLQVDAEQHELLWKLVSERYAQMLGESFPTQNFALHPEQRADITVKDRYFRLEHTMNLRSCNPEKDALKRQKTAANLANKRGEKVPDVYITAHGTGMRHQPQAKYRENIEKGKYRDTPEINMLVKLGTFHSNQKLEYLLRNKVKKNWMVKRYDNNYSSGAMLHTIYPDGRHSLECIPTENLIELGMSAEKIEDAKIALQKAQGEEKKTLQTKIKELESQFQLRAQTQEQKDLIKLTIITDAHIGSPTWPGRPSNYTLLEGAIKYEETTKLPQVLIMTEMLNGALTRPFFSDKETFKLTRTDLESTISAINSDTATTIEEKNKLLSALTLLDDAQTPIPSLDDQARVFDAKVAPFAKKVIANGGIVVIASGNHAQKSSPGVTDEATALARAFTEEEQKSIYMLQAKGVTFGAGVVPLEKIGDERRIYVAHRLKSGSDEIVQLKEQSRGMNLKDTLMIGGDVHQAGAEYADGTGHIIGAGLQAWNSYVDEIGKQAGLRGVVDIHLSRNPKLKNYFRIDYVLDPTLEKKVQDKIDIERKLIENYLPKQ